MYLIRAGLCLMILGVSIAPTAYAQTVPDESQVTSPIDYGYGPGVPIPSNLPEPPLGPVPVPPGGADAQTRGVFGAPVTWPINGLHVGLLPDGRVLNFGTDDKGRQGTQRTGTLTYDIWDPNLGTGKASHMELPTGTTVSTDIFCSAQTLLSTGEMLVVGGDLTINEVHNFSNDNITIFSPRTNSIVNGDHMAFARWYPTLLSMPDGRKLVMGGREDKTTPTITPELYTPGKGWKTLWNATSEAAFGSTSGNWYYTRAFWGPTGVAVIVGNDGQLFTLDPTTDGGTLTTLPTKVWNGRYDLPIVMYRPGKLLALRSQKTTMTIDFNENPPTFGGAGKLAEFRFWSSATVLADGKVLVTGGSGQANKLVDVAYDAQIWDPMTRTWTTGANAQKPRLYHSVALLLPDATVLTAAGGTPGPVINLNAEIYYPSYLYKHDGSGQPADRPTLVTAPPAAQLGTSFTATVGASDTITAVNLVRASADTHAFNPEQRFIPLIFAQNGTQLKINVPGPAKINTVIPGYYMLFAINSAGTPSIAKIVRVLAPST